MSSPGCFKGSVCPTLQYVPLHDPQRLWLCLISLCLDPPPFNPSVQFRCVVNNFLPFKNAWAKRTCVRAWASISNRMHSNTCIAHVYIHSLVGLQPQFDYATQLDNCNRPSMHASEKIKLLAKACHR